MSFDDQRRDWEFQRMRAEAAYQAELSAVYLEHGITSPPPEMVLNYDQRARWIPDQVARMTPAQRASLGKAESEVYARHSERLNHPEFLALDAHALMDKLWFRVHTKFDTEQARNTGRKEHGELGRELHALISKAIEFGISGVPAMPDLDGLEFHKTWQRARELWECVLAHVDKAPRQDASKEKPVKRTKEQKEAEALALIFREGKRLTVDEIAKIVGVHPKTLYKWSKTRAALKHANLPDSAPPSDPNADDNEENE